MVIFWVYIRPGYEPKDDEVGFSTIDPFFTFPISNSPALEECIDCRNVPAMIDPFEVLQLGSTFGGCWPMGLALKRFSSQYTLQV